MSGDKQQTEGQMPPRGPRRWWAKLRRPSTRFSLGALLAIGFVAGIVFTAGFNTAVEATQTENFCRTCHEMRDTVFVEFHRTAHHSSRSGVRAECADCHVPKSFGPKMVRKVAASREVWHKMLGTVSTPEQFEAKRLELAQRVWTYMERTDSRECRSCHSFTHVDYMKQSERARLRHMDAERTGETCISCHKGVAHRLPAMAGM